MNDKYNTIYILGSEDGPAHFWRTEEERKAFEKAEMKRQEAIKFNLKEKDFETSYPKGGLVDEETMRIIDQLNSFPSCPNLNDKEIGIALKKVNGGMENEKRSQNSP